jgi:hypothetical protein
MWNMVVHVRRSPFGPLAHTSDKPYVLLTKKYSSKFVVFSKNIQRICPKCLTLKGQMDKSVRPSRLFRTYDLLWTSNMTILVWDIGCRLGTQKTFSCGIFGSYISNIVVVLV